MNKFESKNVVESIVRYAIYSRLDIFNQVLVVNQYEHCCNWLALLIIFDLKHLLKTY